MYILICIALCKILYVICTSHEIAKYGIDFVQNQMHHQHGSPEMMTNGENCFIYHSMCTLFQFMYVWIIYWVCFVQWGWDIHGSLRIVFYLCFLFGALICFRKKKCYLLKNVQFLVIFHVFRYFFTKSRITTTSPNFNLRRKETC